MIVENHVQLHVIKTVIMDVQKLVILFAVQNVQIIVADLVAALVKMDVVEDAIVIVVKNVEQIVLKNVLVNVNLIV